MRMPQNKQQNSEDDSFTDKNRGQQQQQQVVEQQIKVAKKQGKVLQFLQSMINKNVEPPQQEAAKIDFHGKMDKQSIAMEMLTQGYIQSFIDFFYITHDTVPSISKFTDISGQFLEDQNLDKHVKFNTGSGSYQIPNPDEEQELLELKKELVNAERHSRNKEKYNQAQEAYFSLAEQFFHKKKFNAAGYFFKRIIYLSKISQNKLHEIKSKLGLGRCLEAMENINEAIIIFEENLQEVIQFFKQLSQAEENEYQSIVEDIAKELVSIYSQFAEQYQREDTNQALIYYEKCLQVAQKSGEKHKAATGNISFKIGLLYFNSKEYEKSIEYQKKYLEILNAVKPQVKIDLVQKQMQACKLLAKAYLSLDKLENAKSYLEQYHETARQSTDFNQESKAALLLAKYHQKKGNIIESLKYFQEHFEKAKSDKKVQGQKIQKKRKLIDKARVAYGIAKANHYINDFIQKVKTSDTNIQDLLVWKDKESKNQ